MYDNNVQNSLCITSMKQELSGPTEAHGPLIQGRKGLNLPLFSNFDAYCPFIQNLFSSLFSILARSFPQMVTMNCEEKDLIESL